MNSKKRFILSSLACLSVFGGSVEAMQKSNSAPRMIVRNDEMVSGKEFNQAVKRANRAGAMGTAVGSFIGVGLGGAVTYMSLNENVKKLTDKVDRLTKENEKLQGQLEDAQKKQKDPIGLDPEKDVLEYRVAILFDACKDYHEAAKKFFKDLNDKAAEYYKDAQLARINLSTCGRSKMTIERIRKKMKEAEYKTLNDMEKDLDDLEHEIDHDVQDNNFVLDILNKENSMEEFFGDISHRIESYYNLREFIKGRLFLKHKIDLDKDEDQFKN